MKQMLQIVSIGAMKNLRMKIKFRIYKSADTTQQLVNLTILNQLEKKLVLDLIKKVVDEAKIKNVELASSSDTVSSLPLSNTAPVASGRVKKTKAKVTQVQTQSVVQVGSDNGLPTLQSLKCDHQIQAQVDQRLRELGDMTQTGTSNKVKLQREGQVDVFVHTHVKWPHEFVWSGSTNEHISYDQLQCPSGWLAFVAP